MFHLSVIMMRSFSPWNLQITFCTQVTFKYSGSDLCNLWIFPRVVLTTSVCALLGAPMGDHMPTSSPLGAPSRGVLWRNMAPIRPTHTARLCPLNTRLPESSTVKYVSLEVDTVAVAPASLRSCNAGQGSCFTAAEESLTCFRAAAVLSIQAIGNMYKYTDMRGRQGGDSNEWKIPRRLSYLFHSRLLTPHNPLMYSAISRDGGLCVRLSVSLPSPPQRREQH